NTRQEDIGARRLQTLLERVLEDILFEAPDVTERSIAITVDVVEERIGDIVGDEDLSLYIL
ncbi:MAG TPA: HslU--HslV peptidase ATPase subunit, partial [Thermomicrobiales bacterium]|nr:HslU--HslV peptidase ATPase subunit [Thermomicrobiales bacterium]